MKLYLVQHGIAENEAVNPDRPLTPEGRTDVKAMAAFLAKAGVVVARVGHSGKTRARQTAEILGAALAPDVAVVQQDGLAPKDPVQPWATLLGDSEDDTLLAGHLPFMGRLVALLLTGDEEAGSVAFQPSSVACLERNEGGPWTLQWMVRPELIGSAR